VRSLKEAVGLIAGEKDLVSMSLETNGEEVTEELVDDSADVAGQSYAKRALEVTAAGGHNILIFDPNGTHP
jgi:magnesium chelatase family protein